MRWINKYAYWLICTVFLISLSCYAFLSADDESLCFYVKNETGSQKIEVYTSDDGCSYVFLPSYAEMNQVTIQFSLGQKCVVEDTEIQNGDDCGAFSLGQKYKFRIGEDGGMIQFCRSANVPALYIETASGGMENIYADKTHEEAVFIKLYSPSGDLEYADGNCLLKGRGNSTWNRDKKPFLLKISDEVSLLGMGEDSDWVLLANYNDESNLHNKLIFDMADRVFAEWTPRCEYVDVYLNGQYNGLYLLAEKVESGKSRLDINVAAGDFLCSTDFAIRTETLENPFCTDEGRTISIAEPNILSAEAKNRIVALVNEQERVLLSQEDLTQSWLVDIDSWIRKYLVDEIVGNTDSDLSSSYFYYSDGVFYGGPIWDYDMAFGNTIQNHYPKAYIAKNYVKYSQYHSVYYNALFNNPSFFERMAEIYEDEFLPVIEDLIQYDVRYTADKIASAAVMNRIRWPIQVKENAENDPFSRYVNTADSIIYYLEGKKCFLSDALINRVQYCTIQFELPMASYYWSVSVPRGTVLAETDVVLEPRYDEIGNIKWSINGTDQIFDPAQPIKEDMVLTRVAAGG